MSRVYGAGQGAGSPARMERKEQRSLNSRLRGRRTSEVLNLNVMLTSNYSTIPEKSTDAVVLFNKCLELGGQVKDLDISDDTKALAMRIAKGYMNSDGEAPKQFIQHFNLVGKVLTKALDVRNDPQFDLDDALNKINSSYQAKNPGREVFVD